MMAGNNAPAKPGNPLLDPTQPLQGQGLVNAATALTNAQTQGPLTALAKQIAQNNQQGAASQKATSGYYNQLMPYVQSGVNQVGQIGTNLNNTLSGIQNDTQGRIAGFGQQAQGGALGRMGAMGLDGGSLQNLAAETARQQGVAAQNAGVFRSHGATQGANYQSLAASNLGTYGLRGQERLGQIAQATRLANQPLDSKVAALQASRGALLASNEGKLRQQEITNRVTSAGLGIKADTLAATKQNNAANQYLKAAAIKATLSGQQLQQMRSDRQFQLDQQKFGAATAKDNYLKANGLGPYKPANAGNSGNKPLSTGSQTRYLGQIDQLKSLITQARQAGHTGDAVHNALVSGTFQKGVRAFPAPLVQAAYELLGWGNVTPQTEQKLDDMGISRENLPVKPAPKQVTGVLGGNLFGIGV